MKKPGVFLSYSRRDRDRARDLENALRDLDVDVWRDVRSIAAGERWADAIEAGIRDARALVVFITANSSRSEWVTYEYAYATGASVPVIAVVARGIEVPSPIRRFQLTEYIGGRRAAGAAARKIVAGIDRQSRAIAGRRAAAPALMARFQEENGEIRRASSGRLPSLWMDLWIEHAPRQTRRVAFEILDSGFRDPKWSISRRRSDGRAIREFLTDDMNSYGDVEIWVRGSGAGPHARAGEWSLTSRLYEALKRHYGNRPRRPAILRALHQIRAN